MLLVSILYIQCVCMCVCGSYIYLLPTFCFPISIYPSLCVKYTSILIRLIRIKFFFWLSCIFRRRLGLHSNSILSTRTKNQYNLWLFSFERFGIFSWAGDICLFYFHIRFRHFFFSLSDRFFRMCYGQYACSAAKIYFARLHDALAWFGNSDTI